MAVLEEQQRRIKEAMASKPAPPPEDNLEMKAAMKAMGAMEEGDAIFGSGSEVNLDSQVLHLAHSPSYHFCSFIILG